MVRVIYQKLSDWRRDRCADPLFRLLNRVTFYCATGMTLQRTAFLRERSWATDRPALFTTSRWRWPAA
jgi:hypothetical protein